MLGGLDVAADVALEDGHWYGRRQLEAITLGVALQVHLLALVGQVAHVVLGHQAVAHVGVMLQQEARQAQDQVVVQPVAAVALAALTDRQVGVPAGRREGGNDVQGAQ